MKSRNLITLGVIVLIRVIDGVKEYCHAHGVERAADLIGALEA